MRNLKTMGLALVAIFAMFAMSAAAAQADKADFWAEEGTVKIDVEAEGSQNLTTPGKNITCQELDGHAAYSKETNELTGTEFNFTNCTTTILGFINLPTTVFPSEGCHFTFTAGTFNTTAGDAEGSVDICEVTLNQYTSSAHTTLYCQQHVTAQEVSGLTYTNAKRGGTDAVTVDVNAEVETTVTNLGKVGCSTHETDKIATYTGSFWAYGTNEDEEVTDTKVTGTPTL